MTFTVEVLLKETNRVVETTATETVGEPAEWTEKDVRAVLGAILRAFDRIKNPDAEGERPIALRGLSWVVLTNDPPSALIAIEIPSGAVVAGPFSITPERLEGLISRVLATASDRSHVH